MGEIRGISIARTAPRVSHLFFADDSLIFLRATVAECEVLSRVLKRFELASGQLINVDKSTVLFSSNTPDSIRASIMQYLGIHKILTRDKYLGMPIMIGKSKRAELEAKYFARGTFLTAPLGSNPSFVWRSLLAGHEVLKLGSRWRIGDGLNVDIWRDKWLKKPPDYKPRPKPDTICISHLVSSLMTPDRQWDVDLLDEFFELDDVHCILCIPLTSLMVKDALIWNHTGNGHYTVRSGYCVARRLLGKELNQVEERKEIWRIIWRAFLLPKVKYFLWRLIYNILPTKINLQNRGVGIDGGCAVCSEAESSLFHVFFGCYFSRRVWDMSCPWIQGYLDDWASTDNFWECLFIKASQLGSMELASSLLWLIWHNRNVALHEGVCKIPSSVCTTAARIVTEHEASHRRLNLIPQPRGYQLWSPPSMGDFKLNTDATFKKDLNQAGLGAIIRDKNVRVLVSAISRIDKVPDPLFAEIYAIRFDLILAMNCGFLNCEIECDSLLAIQEIKRVGKVLWEGGILIEQIRILAAQFSYVSFNHVAEISQIRAALCVEERTCNNRSFKSFEEVAIHPLLALSYETNKWYQSQPLVELGLTSSRVIKCNRLVGLKDGKHLMDSHNKPKSSPMMRRDRPALRKLPLYSLQLRSQQVNVCQQAVYHAFTREFQVANMPLKGDDGKSSHGMQTKSKAIVDPSPLPLDPNSKILLQYLTDAMNEMSLAHEQKMHQLIGSIDRMNKSHDQLKEQTMQNRENIMAQIVPPPVAPANNNGANQVRVVPQVDAAGNNNVPPPRDGAARGENEAELLPRQKLPRTLLTILRERKVGRPSFHKPYPEEYDRLHPLPRKYKVPDFSSFFGTSIEKTTLEHIARFTLQCGEANLGYHKLRLFPNSLTGAAFTWYINLPPNLVRTWEDMERMFPTQFYRTEPEVSMADLSRFYQKKGELDEDYLARFKKLRNRCCTPLREEEFLRLANNGLDMELRKKFEGVDFRDFFEMSTKVARYETFPCERKTNEEVHHMALTIKSQILNLELLKSKLMGLLSVHA
ncbi:reverse transcriptase [Corchorus capsularis]|uniref:Reverse transcriptase n=1 Tax=Corchorus capsularis TaxID=210143 RepID=A0A1R3JN50_COCAP|nr:reverse transcriptase [Corchorus capsularis]